MTQYTKPAVLPPFAESGDKVQPTNPELQTGWPNSAVPPSRQRFNWVLNFAANSVRYFMQRGISEWDAAEDYPIGARVQRSGLTYVALLGSGNINQDPASQPTYWERWGFAISELFSFIDSTYSKSVAGNVDVTLTAVEARNTIITLTGALTGNINVIVPTNTKRWVFINSTTGAFTLTVKTATGSGILIPQNSSETEVRGNGINIIQGPQNIAAGTGSTHAMRLGQKPLTLLQAYTTAGTNNPVVPAGVFGIYYKVWAGGGGGGGGATGAQSGNGAGAGGYVEGWMAVTPGQTLTAIIGIGGTGGANTGLAGTNGGASSLSNGTQTVTCTGGSAGSGGGTGGGTAGVGTGGDLNMTGGNGSGPALVNAAGTLFYGPPGGSSYGVGNSAVGYGTGAGAVGRTPGAGGAGGAGGSAGAFAGGNGGVGSIYIWG